ncbi:kelch-like protein 24a [Saccostrea cucullata]|uniref:kelch-like protein 24a n=1 Tax=Saccostrea cuccullata TaxID=36930 RepID=UPI002ED36D13
MKMEEESSSVSSCLLEGLRKMYKSQRFTDVIINVENQSFRCHRVILSSVSPYFDAMFSSGMKESNSMEISLHKTSSKLFHDILQYVYLGKDIVKSDTVGDLLQISSMLQITCLQIKCEDYITRNIDVHNCIGVWKLGKSHNIEKLVDNSHPFILNNFEDVWESNDFLKLEKDELENLIRDERLNVSGEEVVCKALFNWIAADEARRKIAFPELFEHIRLTSINLEFLLDQVDQHHMVLEHSACRTAVKNAIKYHALPSRRQELTWDEKPYRINTEQEQILAIVGKRLSGNDTIVTEFVGYSFANKKWVALQPIVADIGEDFAVCSYGHDIFITGGTTNMTSCIRYSAKLSQWRERSSMQYGRYRHSMVAMSDSLFVFGGYNFGTLNSVEQYDMGTEAWKQVGELHFGVDSSSAAVIGENVYIFGGSLGFTEETAGIQCFNTKTYTCSLIANLPTPPKFSSAIKFADVVYVVCDNGEVISFSANEGHRVTHRIKKFSRKNFGLFIDKGTPCIIGGNQNVFSDEDKLCSDVIKIAEEPSTHDSLELPFPMEVINCVRTVVARKYPLLECRSLIREFVDVD